MKRSTVIVIVLLAILSLTAIVVGQIYWVKKAFKMEENQFNERVVSALSVVVDEILVMNRDSAVTEPVKQVSDNFFIANINDTPHPFLLETLLKDQFENHNLKEDFEYGIYDCFNDSIVFGSKISFNKGETRERASQIHNLKEFQPDGHYFGVYFPNKTRIILTQLDFWMYSSIVILLIILFFGYVIFVVFRQKKLSEIKADFVNNMTHELKTPISTIALSAEALEMPDVANDPGRVSRYVRIIKNENSRLKGQVERVLQIATMTPKQINLKLSRVDLHDVILKAEETFKVQIEELEGTLTNDLNATRYCIQGDLVHITNVIYNLLDNATKYSDKTPAIVVSTKNKKDEIFLEIKDNGVGIEPKYLNAIFDKFYRVPTGDIHDVRGFGLGLFYVKTIVKAHKGRIEVDSIPGKGSTFTIIFKTVD